MVLKGHQKIVIYFHRPTSEEPSHALVGSLLWIISGSIPAPVSAYRNIRIYLTRALKSRWIY